MGMGAERTSLKYPADVVLAELMYKKLGLEVTPEAVKKFLQDNWHTVSMLAHMIHNEMYSDRG